MSLKDHLRHMIVRMEQVLTPSRSLLSPEVVATLHEEVFYC